MRLARFTADIYLTNKPIDSSVYFTGIPSPAAAGLVLLPLIFNLSNIIEVLNLNGLIEILSLSNIFNIENNKIASSIFIITTAILMVSKIPTYSLKRIRIPRRLGVIL